LCPYWLWVRILKLSKYVEFNKFIGVYQMKIAIYNVFSWVKIFVTYILILWNLLKKVMFNSSHFKKFNFWDQTFYSILNISERKKKVKYVFNPYKIIKLYFCSTCLGPYRVRCFDRHVCVPIKKSDMFWFL
jgi:hypothetical protein